MQKAAVAALTGSQDCVKEMLAGYISLRDKVVAGPARDSGPHLRFAERSVLCLSRTSATTSGAAGLNSASDVARKLLHEAHVVVVPGEGFGTQDHVRMSYAVSEDRLTKG